MLVLKYVKRGGKICGNFQKQQEGGSMYQLQFCQDLWQIKEKFQILPNFPKIFRVQYEDKDLETMVDLDSPIQLVNKSSNILIVMEEIPDSDV